MKLSKNILAFLLFSTCIKVFAADQRSDLGEVLFDYARHYQDLGVLQGLAKAASLIDAVHSKNIVMPIIDYQLMTQTQCQYEASRTFEKNLRDSIDTITSLDLRAELSELEGNLRSLHNENDPYKKEDWPRVVETCQKTSDKYRALLALTRKKIEEILDSYQRSLPAKREHIIAFIRDLSEAGQISQEIVTAVQDLLRQKGALEKELTGLEAEKNSLAQLHGERERIDKQLAKLRLLRTQYEQEIGECGRRKNSLTGEYQQKKQECDEEFASFRLDLQGKKAAEEAALEQALKQRQEEAERKNKEALNQQEAALAALNKQFAEQEEKIKANLARLKQDLKERQESVSQELANLDKQLGQKRKEVEDFKIPFGKLIETSFPNLLKEPIKFVGLNMSNPVCKTMQESLNKLLEALQLQFEAETPDFLSRPERAVQLRLSFKFVYFRPKSGFLSDGFETSVFVVAEANHFNSKDAINQRAISLEFDNEGALRGRKSAEFLTAFEDLIIRQIPELKRRVYENYLRTDNQQQLFELANSVLKDYPVSALSPAAGTYLQAPALPSAPFYPFIQETYEPGEHSFEGQPHELSER